MLDEVQAAWRALAHQQRCRVTVACVPMHDVEENAAIVNALQRHADVIVKKSLEEGFGLGVTEALWKRRAVVASDVGGHRDQIKHQHNGLLVDPTDPRSLGPRSQSCSPTRHERAHSATLDTTVPGLKSRRRRVAHASRSSAAAFRPRGRGGVGPARMARAIFTGLFAATRPVGLPAIGTLIDPARRPMLTGRDIASAGPLPDGVSAGPLYPTPIVVALIWPPIRSLSPGVA